MTKIPSLASFWDMLNEHDWYYEFSDSIDVHRKGDQSLTRIKSVATELLGSYYDLYQDFKEHKFSGKVFGTPQKPKPAKPAQE